MMAVEWEEAVRPIVEGVEPLPRPMLKTVETPVLPA
jgi:hypothetical protein